MPKIIPLGTIDPVLYGIAKRRATMMENGTMSFVGAFENEMGRIVFKKVGDVVHAIVDGVATSNVVGFSGAVPNSGSLASSEKRRLDGPSRMFTELTPTGGPQPEGYSQFSYSKKGHISIANETDGTENSPPDGSYSSHNIYRYRLVYGALQSEATEASIPDGEATTVTAPQIGDYYQRSDSTYVNSGSVAAGRGMGGTQLAMGNFSTGAEYGESTNYYNDFRGFFGGQRTHTVKAYIRSSRGFSDVVIGEYSVDFYSAYENDYGSNLLTATATGSGVWSTQSTACADGTSIFLTGLYDYKGDYISTPHDSVARERFELAIFSPAGDLTAVAVDPNSPGCYDYYGIPSNGGSGDVRTIRPLGHSYQVTGNELPNESIAVATMFAPFFHGTARYFVIKKTANGYSVSGLSPTLNPLGAYPIMLVGTSLFVTGNVGGYRRLGVTDVVTGATTFNAEPWNASLRPTLVCRGGSVFLLTSDGPLRLSAAAFAAGIPAPTGFTPYPALPLLIR